MTLLYVNIFSNDAQNLRPHYTNGLSVNLTVSGVEILHFEFTNQIYYFQNEFSDSILLKLQEIMKKCSILKHWNNILEKNVLSSHWLI